MAEFRANTDQMYAGGKNIQDQADQLLRRIESIYNEVETVRNNEYQSAASDAIYNKIQSKKNALIAHVNRIKSHGNYLISASKTIINNEENIMDSISKY